MRVVLLVNLGSPNNLTVASIRTFLRKFLSDKRVVSLPRILWYPILFGIVLPFRAKRLIRQYRYIWINEKSPLIHYTQSQATKLQEVLSDKQTVLHAFSYSYPEITMVLEQLHKHNKVDEIVVLPLYPQFSSTTTSTVFDQFAKFYSNKKYLPKVEFIRDFHNNDHYVNAIVSKISQHIEQFGKPEKLIFSFHSLPNRIIQSGDMYYEQCMSSATLFVKSLGLQENDYIVTFQSRFGGGKWLSPVTLDTMEDLAKSGIKHIAVVCPGFISDCLETLEEIAVTNKDVFIKNGGESYYYIPCLNDSNECINMLYQLIKE